MLVKVLDRYFISKLVVFRVNVSDMYVVKRHVLEAQLKHNLIWILLTCLGASYTVSSTTHIAKSHNSIFIYRLTTYSICCLVTLLSLASLFSGQNPLRNYSRPSPLSHSTPTRARLTFIITSGGLLIGQAPGSTATDWIIPCRDNI